MIQTDSGFQLHTPLRVVVILLLAGTFGAGGMTPPISIESLLGCNIVYRSEQELKTLVLAATAALARPAPAVVAAVASAGHGNGS